MNKQPCENQNQPIIKIKETRNGVWLNLFYPAVGELTPFYFVTKSAVERGELERKLKILDEEFDWRLIPLTSEPQ